MRVNRHGLTNAAGQRQATGAAPSGTAFQLPSAPVAKGGAAPAAAGAGALPAAASLLALQEFADREQRRRRTVERGCGLLQSLEQLRRELLDGTVPAERRLDLRDQLRRFDIEADEPELRALMRAIELRCAVELAKLDRGAA